MLSVITFLLSKLMIGLVYLFNGLSNPNWLFSAKILFISKCLILIATLFSMFHHKSFKTASCQFA